MLILVGVGGEGRDPRDVLEAVEFEGGGRSGVELTSPLQEGRVEFWGGAVVYVP